MGKPAETSDRGRSSDWALHVTAEDVQELAAGADDVLDAAALVLDANWVGASTVPSKGLYPHQWSWDSAFIAIGNAWQRRAHAQLELETLFAGQWRSGMLPHIVFNPSVTEAAYFPGSAFWQTESAAAAPRSPRTSGITQPPIHARAALEIHRHARDGESSRAFLKRLYPALVAQHDYLARARDARGSGLAAIVHPWESGLDNSPVWDHDLALLRIPVGSLPDFDRRDLQQAAAADRPTDAAYRRYLYLVTLFREAKWDDAAIMESSPFLIADPLFNAIYLWSTLALIEIASVVGADPAPHREAAERIHRGIVEQLWVPDAQRFCPWDLRRDEREPQDTIVSFAPLLDPDLPDEMVGRDLRRARVARLPRRRGRDPLCRAERWRPLDGLRPSTVLARSGLAQHELAAVGGPAPARAPRVWPIRSSPARWPSCEALAFASISTRSAVRVMGARTSAGAPHWRSTWCGRCGPRDDGRATNPTGARLGR